MESTERDILIEVKTKVELLTLTIAKLSDKLDLNSNDNDSFRSRLDKIEPKVEENCKFRFWIYTSLASSLIGIIVWLVNLFINKLL